MSKKKAIYLIIMTIILCIMTLGYAALQERIDVEVQADIDSTYRVEITNVQEGTVVGDARSTQAPSYNDLTATFNVGLTNDTDYITYAIEITNYSTVDIRLNNVEMNTTNNNMKVVKIGISNGDILLAGSTKTFTVKIKLETETYSEQTSTITVIPDFTRLKGGLGTAVEEVYDAYEIGDVVSFAGSNWYVIKESYDDEDYVTLLKQNVLTAEELTDNYSCKNTSGVAQNRMAYYWSNTCHRAGTFGTDTYDSSDTSGCSGHSNYAGSKVKLASDNYMNNVLGAYNLKEVDNYKIRQITEQDLRNNLGWTNGARATTEGNNVPLWVYRNFGGDYYYTMVPNNSMIHIIDPNPGDFRSAHITEAYPSVRPVINLYKAAID